MASLNSAFLTHSFPASVFHKERTDLNIFIGFNSYEFCASKQRVQLSYEFGLYMSVYSKLFCAGDVPDSS